MKLFVFPLLRRILRMDARNSRRSIYNDQKILKSKLDRAVRRVCAENRQRQPRLVGYTILGHDVRDARVRLFFRDNAALKQAEASGYPLHLRCAVLNALRQDCFPNESLNAIKVEFLGKREFRAAGSPWE